MALVGGMDLELVDAVGVEITGVATELNRVGDIHEVELPFIGRPALHDVVYQLQLLEVLVCLTVKLEVSFQVGLVGAQLADVGSPNVD